MKIAIPSGTNNIETDVYASFGRAPFYLIYNTETAQGEFLTNLAATSPGGAGIKAAQFLVDRQVDALIAPRCGQNAADVINAANIRIFKSIDGSLSNNLKAMEEGRLELLDHIHPGFHGHGGR